MHQADIGTDDGAAADHGISPQHGGAGIDNAVILHSRMALLASNELSFVVAGEADRTQCHTLIHPHTIANLGCLSDDHACAMVNEETPANSSAGVNVDSCA